VVRALGYEVQEEEATASAEQRRDILSQLSAGTISSDDAVRLLKAR
jgi:hypothetical protein